MFDLLRKKIGGFIDSIVKKNVVDDKEPVEIAKKAEEKQEKPEEKPQVEKKEPPEESRGKQPEEKRIEEKKPEEKPEIKIHKPEIKTGVSEPEPPEPQKQIKQAKPVQVKQIQEKPEPEKLEVQKEIIGPKTISEKPNQSDRRGSDVSKLGTPHSVTTLQIVDTIQACRLPPQFVKREEERTVKKEKEEPDVKKGKKAEPDEKKEQKTEPRVKIGILKQVTSIITGEIEINESEISELLENLELELLESDVAIEVADEIKTDLKKGIAGNRIKRGELDAFIKSTIRNTLVRIVKSEKGFDILERIEASETPMKIIFLGTNGAGKTTTIAKVAKMLMDNGYSIVLASADTFRAAAIEQMQVHADRLGVKNIKREYGSDPTAVAYDAVNYAKAHSIDAVLIDTAGRQETDLNLINELKKMNRVIQPHLKIYVGESIAGNAIISQVVEFNEAVGIDGVILTKLDCDAKGGTVLSITKATGIPIVYIGTGQKYDDLEKFDAEKIIERILS